MYDISPCDVYSVWISRNIQHWISELPELFVVAAGLKNGSKISCNSMCASLTSRKVSLVFYMHSSFYFENICSTNKLTELLC